MYNYIVQSLFKCQYNKRCDGITTDRTKGVDIIYLYVSLTINILNQINVIVQKPHPRTTVATSQHLRHMTWDLGLSPYTVRRHTGGGSNRNRPSSNTPAQL